MADPQPDPVADYLRGVQTSDAVRAQVWDAVYGAKDDADLQQRLMAAPVPNNVRADLFDLYPKVHASQSAQPAQPAAPAAAAPVDNAPWWQKLGHAITSAQGAQAATLAHPEVVQGQADVIPQVAAGAAKGVASTAVHGGDVIRRVTGQPRIVSEPDVQSLITPSNALQKVGFGAEQSAEFVAPMSKVANASKTLSLGGRMLAESGAAAGVAGVQSGADPGTMLAAAGTTAVLPMAGAVGRAVKQTVSNAAAGAAEGGMGGALASVVRNVAPPAPKAMVIQALKPRSTRVNFDAALDRAMPEIAAAQESIGKPITGLNDLLEATKAAKQNIQAQLGQMRGQTQGFQVDLSPVADAMTAAIPKKTMLENPGMVERLHGIADVYRKPFALDEAETLLRETNAQLDGFYQMYPQAKHAAKLANPAVATLEAQAKGLRDAIYARLDEPGGGAAARELQRRYGALLEVEDSAMRRANVAARQQPVSLSEQIGAVRAAGDIARGLWKLSHGNLMGAADIAAARAGRAMATSLKEAQTSDALVRRAFQAYKGRPVPVDIPQPRSVAGLLERGPIVTPPPADRSFVRGVPAQYARRDVRGLLPAGEPQAPLQQQQQAIPLPGEIQPDPSGVSSVPAAPIDYAVDPTVPVKAGGFRVSQFSGDPQAAAAAVAKPEVRAMLERMRDDLDVFTPQRGRLVNEIKVGMGNSDHYAPGGAGSPVGDDIRVISEQNVGNHEIKRAITDLLKGKKPTNRLHTAALDAAMGYLEKRPGYRGPSVPAGLNEDDGFEAFSRAVDGLREP